MRYLPLLVCLFYLSACGGNEAPKQGNSTATTTKAAEPAVKTDDVLFQDQRTALQKARGVEDMVLDTEQKRRAQMAAQE